MNGFGLGSLFGTPLDDETQAAITLNNETYYGVGALPLDTALRVVGEAGASLAETDAVEGNTLVAAEHAGRQHAIYGDGAVL